MLDDSHCVAIRIKTVAFLDCEFVRPHGEIVARKGCNEHEQGRARKVKVRDHSVHCFEAIWWPNEDAGLAGVCGEQAVISSGGLQGAHRGCANGPDMISISASL